MGLLSYLPIFNKFLLNRSSTGGTDSARYCYSVWLRHLVHAKKSGLNINPQIIGELGPGDSIGVGLAALISGSEQYFAFDVVSYASITKNNKIFDELVTLFKEKTAIPGDEEFPRVKPNLDSYDFPYDILDEKRMEISLQKSRLEKIKNSIKNANSPNSLISYFAPWSDKKNIKRDSVDMIFSQAVLEHVEDLQSVYRTIHSWLKPKGYSSNQIDFKSHGFSNEWNGHWTYSSLFWKLTIGRRPWTFINREPCSSHKIKIKNAGFKIINELLFKSKSRIKRKNLAQDFKNISEDDLTISGAFFQMIKE